MNEAQFHLSSAKLKKLQKGATFQMSHPELMNTEGGKGLHHVNMQFDPKGFKNLKRNLLAGKGFRFSKSVVVGHGLWDDLKEGASKAGDFVKKYVPRNMVKTGLTAGATALGSLAGNPELGALAAPLISKAVDYGYDKTGKKQAEEKAAAPSAPAEAPKRRRRRAPPPPVYDEEDYGDDDEADYEPIRRAPPPPSPPPRKKRAKKIHRDSHAYTGGTILLKQKLKKGSPEMAAKMAALRAMRKGGKKGKTKGEGMWDWLDPNKNGVAKAFDPNQNGVAKAFDPNQNGVAKAFSNAFDPQKNNVAATVNQALGTVADAFKPGGSAEDFGKKIASALIHQGIPQATAAICGALAEAAFPEGGAAAGFLGSQAGKALGNAIADKVGQSTGYGLQNLGGTLFVKGGAFVRGVPLPIYTDSTKERIQTHGMLSHQRGTRNGLLQGGSFLALGSKGGSFMSPP